MKNQCSLYKSLSKFWGVNLLSIDFIFLCLVITLVEYLIHLVGCADPYYCCDPNQNVNLIKTTLLTVSTRGIIKTTALHAARSTIVIFFIFKVGELLCIIIYSDFRDRSIPKGSWNSAVCFSHFTFVTWIKLQWWATW